MNEQELGYLRDLHAGMAMLGLLMKGDTPTLNVPTLAYEIADGMQQARMLSDDEGNFNQTAIRQKGKTK